ncbi:hypothetical protein C0992_003177 [Termitomyces sp. T32_za158]|nr:hypothetical protein C0992_003177 [Termitomyces sp. T32_za158]
MDPSTQRMPPRNHFSAPKWDETKPRELGQYFKELEYLLCDCGVTEHIQMKEYAACYVSYDTADIWTGLAEFGAAMPAPGNQAPVGANYDTWKAAVIRLYLGAEESTKYTVSDLQNFVQDTFDNGIYTIGDLSTYYRNFTRIARWLVQNGKLYRNEERRLFQQRFPTSLCVRIASRLEVVFTDHHPEEPYDIEAVFEAGKWKLRGTDTTISSLNVGTAHGSRSTTPGIIPVSGTSIVPLPTPPPANDYVKKEEVDAAIATAVSSAMTRIETMLSNSFAAQPCANLPGSNLCHFCGEVGHTMTRGRCATLKNYIRQGRICRAANGKVVLSSGALIPNYPELKSYQERVDEWHRPNLGNLAAATLTGNANPNAEQALHQQLVHEVLHFEPVISNAAPPPLSRMDLLEREIQSLKNQVFDGIKIRPPKQPLKGYRPLATAPAPSAHPATNSCPSAPPPAAPAPTTDSTAKTTVPAPAPIVSAPPPLHPYAGLPNRYVPPTQHNFAAPDKRPEGDYQPTAPVYDIEKSNHVFTRIIKTPVTLSVEELCSIAPNVRNQVKTAVTPKRTLQATVQDVEDVDDALPRFAVTTKPSADSSTPITQQLINAASVDPIETYLKSLSLGEEPAILTVAKDSHAIRSIMVTVDSRQEVEAIVDSGSQIISMSAEIANELGISYDPGIVLNMQSANGTIDRSLGLAKNVPCMIGDLIFYLQIHILWSPAYDILLGRPFDILARSVVKTLSDNETTLTISDPNTGMRRTVPTFPRGCQKEKLAKAPVFTNRWTDHHHACFHPPSRK